MAKKVAKKRSPKSKRTEVTWANEDVTRRALDALDARLTQVEDWILAEEKKKSSEIPEGGQG